LSMLGHIYQELELITAAESYYIRASILAESLHGSHTKDSNLAKLDLALFYELNKMYDKAELVFKERIPGFVKTAAAIDENIFEAILDLSHYFLRREMYDSSLHYLSLSVLLESLNRVDSKQLFRYFNLNTRSYLSLNDFDNSLGYALKAQVIVNSDSINFSDDDRLRASEGLYIEGCRKNIRQK
jgi:hypothetical protein